MNQHMPSCRCGECTGAPHAFSDIEAATKAEARTLDRLSRANVVQVVKDAGSAIPTARLRGLLEPRSNRHLPPDVHAGSCRCVSCAAGTPPVAEKAVEQSVRANGHLFTCHCYAAECASGSTTAAGRVIKALAASPGAHPENLEHLPACQCVDCAVARGDATPACDTCSGLGAVPAPGFSSKACPACAGSGKVPKAKAAAKSTPLDELDRRIEQTTAAKVQEAVDVALANERRTLEVLSRVAGGKLASKVTPATAESAFKTLSRFANARISPRLGGDTAATAAQRRSGLRR